jgi:hypothetical protein
MVKKAKQAIKERDDAFAVLKEQEKEIDRLKQLLNQQSK